MPSVKILIPYFGRWPDWMPLFLESCRHNPSFEWLFYTDCDNCDLPDNVHLRPISFVAYQELVSKRLGIAFRPENAYKLCDLKPLLGLVHEEELRGYDFWGFGDIDLVYGNLARYFSKERLACHDLISTHARRVSGHLCLLRNNDTMRHAFRQVTDWQQLLSNPAHRFFDESAFSRLFVRRKNWPDWARDAYYHIDPSLKRLDFHECFTTPNGHIPWKDGSFRFPQRWTWQQGELLNDLEGVASTPYFHFMYWKRGWNLSAEQDDIRTLATAGNWQMTEAGITAVKED